MGGKSSEHEISLISGREIVRNLDQNKFNIIPVVISKDGERWQLTSANSLYNITDPIKYKGTSKEIQLSEKRIFTDIKNIPKKPDIVFIAMHGAYGEDGKIQGMLDFIGLKYTGSGVLASSLGMNKLMFRKIMRNENIDIPKFTYIQSNESLTKIKKFLGNPPYFIKPNDQGSSMGASVVRSTKGLIKSLKMAWKYSDIALVDEYIKGKEITCGVLGNGKPFPLPLVEIIPKKGIFFNYESKYLENGSDEIVPARITIKLTKKIQEIAVKVYKVLGCRGFSRIDFILNENNTPFVLEINTIPGLTPMSLLPKAAKFHGLSYPQLIDKIISYALE